MYNNLSDSVSTKGERMNFLIRKIFLNRSSLGSSTCASRWRMVNSHPAGLFSINAEMAILLATWMSIQWMQKCPSRSPHEMQMRIAKTDANLSLNHAKRWSHSEGSDTEECKRADNGSRHCSRRRHWSCSGSLCQWCRCRGRNDLLRWSVCWCMCWCVNWCLPGRLRWRRHWDGRRHWRRAWNWSCDRRVSRCIHRSILWSIRRRSECRWRSHRCRNIRRRRRRRRSGRAVSRHLSRHEGAQKHKHNCELHHRCRHLGSHHGWTAWASTEAKNERTRIQYRSPTKGTWKYGC